MLGLVKDVVGVYKGFLVGSSVAVLVVGYYEENPFAAVGQSTTKDVLTDQWISMRTRLPNRRTAWPSRVRISLRLLAGRAVPIRQVCLPPQRNWRVHISGGSAFGCASIRRLRNRSADRLGPVRSTH